MKNNINKNTYKVDSNNWLRFGKNQLVAYFFLYLGLNIVIFCFTPPASFIMQDTNSYLEPAQLLVNEGIYVSDLRLPGYPIMLAALLLLTDNLGLVTIFLQSIIAFATGVIAGRLAERIRKDTGLFTLLFTCFNPVTLFYVQSMLSDLLFTFLFVAHLFYLVKVFDKLSIWPAVIAGVLAGLAAVVRGNGQFLILVFPVLLWLGYRSYSQQLALKKLALIIAINLVSSLIIVAPWLHWNLKNGNNLSFSSMSYRNYVIHENVITAVVHCKGTTLGEAKQLVYDKLNLKSPMRHEWNSTNTKHVFKVVAQNPLNTIKDVCGSQIISGVLKTLATFFLSSEGRNWAQMWQLDKNQRLEANLIETLSDFSLTAILRGESNVSNTTIFWHVLTLGFVILVRILNVVGLICIVKKKHWYLIIPLLVYFLIFAGTAGFIGYSRFRLPLKPLLAILASIGLLEMLKNKQKSQ